VNSALLIQTAISAVAVAMMVGLAAWARIARPTPPLDEAAARALLAEEFPGEPVEAIWVAGDGKGALARSGASGLVICRVGDGYMARHIPWRQALAATAQDGRLRLELGDVTAPRAVLAFAAWPPKDLAA
jgi:hypothetical protein